MLITKCHNDVVTIHATYIKRNNDACSINHCCCGKEISIKYSHSVTRTACSFRSAQAATLLEFHVPFTKCFVCRWFCVVHDPKPPLHSHNSLSFGKFQDTERFLIHCERHFSSRLPPSGGTWKYAKAPSTKKTRRDSLPIDMLLYAVSVLVVAQSSSEIPEGLMNNPVQVTLQLVDPLVSNTMNNLMFQCFLQYTSHCFV